MTTAQAYREVCQALSEGCITHAMESMSSVFLLPRKIWRLLAYHYGIDDTTRYHALIQSIVQAEPATHKFLSRLYWIARVESRLHDEADLSELAASLTEQFNFEMSFSLALVTEMCDKIREACYGDDIFEAVEQLYSAQDLCHMLREHFVSPYGLRLASRATSILKDTVGNMNELLKETISNHLQTHGMIAEQTVTDQPPPAHIQLEIQDVLDDPTQAQNLWQTLHDAVHQHHEPTDAATQPPEH